jgi:hypothetical protein
MSAIEKVVSCAKRRNLVGLEMAKYLVTAIDQEGETIATVHLRLRNEGYCYTEQRLLNMYDAEKLPEIEKFFEDGRAKPLGVLELQVDSGINITPEIAKAMCRDENKNPTISQAGIFLRAMEGAEENGEDPIARAVEKVGYQRLHGALWQALFYMGEFFDDCSEDEQTECAKLIVEVHSKLEAYR